MTSEDVSQTDKLFSCLTDECLCYDGEAYQYHHYADLCPNAVYRGTLLSQCPTHIIQVINAYADFVETQLSLCVDDGVFDIDHMTETDATQQLTASLIDAFRCVSLCISLYLSVSLFPHSFYDS